MIELSRQYIDFISSQTIKLSVKNSYFPTSSSRSDSPRLQITEIPVKKAHSTYCSLSLCNIPITNSISDFFSYIGVNVIAEQIKSSWRLYFVENSRHSVIFCDVLKYITIRVTILGAM